MADSLRDELLAIAGIDAADIDGGTETPAGVRVRLSPDADAEAVGREVQRVLATHGMRSHMTELTPTESAPPPPPGAPAPVVALPGIDTAPAHAFSPEPVAVAVPRVEVSTEVEPEPEEPESAETELAETEPAEREGLLSIAVEEGRSGVTVRVSGSGKTVSRRTRATGPGLDESIVAAVGELALGADTPPLLLAVKNETIEETHVITVLLEVGEAERRVGSAILEGGRPYAVARATWVALTEPG